jgi:hypothetical protein
MNRKRRRRKFALLKRDCDQAGHPKLKNWTHCLCAYLASLDAKEQKEIWDKVEAAKVKS